MSSTTQMATQLVTAIAPAYADQFDEVDELAEKVYELVDGKQEAKLMGSSRHGGVGTRLLVGWGFGTLVSVLGMAVSATLDLPTGATVVCTFGVMLLALALLSGRLGRPWKGAAVLGGPRRGPMVKA